MSNSAFSRTGTSFASSAEAIARASTVKASSPGTMPTDNFSNLSIAASVGSKILTVALKGEDGNDPSATNKVSIKFRSATLTDSKPVTRDITGALSIALPSGATLGFTATEAGRIYVWALDNAGTVMLGLSRTADIYQETNLHTATDIGTGSDSASVMYVTSHVDSLPVRCIGYIEITTGGTAGEWDNAPTKVQVMHNGVKRTGDVVQVIINETGAAATGATNIPFDDTVPAITEGDEYMTLAVTPTSVCNVLYIDVVLFIALSALGWATAALFQDATSAALATGYLWVERATVGGPICLRHKMISGTISATTMRVRAGSAATLTLNGSGSRLFGGTMASSITITEVMA